MKKILLIFSLGLLLLASCKTKPFVDPSDPINTQKGKLILSLNPVAPIVINTALQATQPQAKSDDNQVDLSKFGLAIKNNAGETVHQYASYSDLPAELILTAGRYNVTAQNDGVVHGAAFDKPLYSGSKDFIVSVGSSTKVGLTCEVKSTGVQVKYSENMLAKLKDIEVTVSIVDGASLTFAVAETRTGWYSVPSDGKISVYVRAVNKETGKDVHQSQTISSVKARELRRVNLDVKVSGSIGVEITIDPTVISKEVTVEVPDSDDIIDNNGDGGSWEEGGEDPGPDPDPITPPTIIGASHNGVAFDIDNDVLTIDRGAVSTVLDVALASTGKDGIRSLFLTIDSPSLNELLASQFGMSGQVDLANPPTEDPGWVGLFSDPSIGIIDANNPIVGKSLHTFSVGGLMSMLAMVDTEGGITHKFTLRVVDASGETTKTLKLQITAKL